MKKIFLIAGSIALMSLYSCNSEPKKEEPKEEIPAEEVDSTVSQGLVLENNGLTLEEVIGSPEFPETKLTINTPTLNSENELGAIDFNFSVTGGDYKLGTQSADATTKGCANSGKGQHIHLIIDNNPYSASYDTTFTKEGLEAGNHVALAFISRSYHESLKHDGAYAITQFKVGEAEMDEIDLEAPHLFYSRPKGSYKGDDIKNVMLDFYLVNTKISEDGNYVLVKINDSEFKITKWCPYFIKGLPLGTVKIDIQLMDKDGNFIEGPFNHEVREVTLTAE